MIFYDTETCGLFGMAVLCQWARDDGPIHLHNFWKSPIAETLELIEQFMAEGTCGFNLAFDHFHLCKIYTTFSSYHDHDAVPEDIIPELAELEYYARDGQCVKPVTALDLFLHARKGPYQSLMDRGDIRIRRVPTPLAWQLANELEKRIPLKDVYFARKSDKTADKWNVYDVEDDDGVLDTDFKDVVLKFAPSSALKALAVDALDLPDDDVLLFADVDVDKTFRPVELGWAPFAKAVGSRQNWRGAWPEVIKYHINHWQYNNLARKYATKDVEYTRALYEHFGRPEAGDDDSVLACMVAACRWRGFRVDIPYIKELRDKAEVASKRAPTAPNYVKNYIWPHLTEDQRLVTGGSTAKVILEDIAKWVDDCDCEDGCERCGGTGEIRPPAAIKAREVLDARIAQKEIELYDKLIQAGRFHASFKIIGTLSSRMAGADGLNPQAIKSTKEVRRAFPLFWPGYVLCGGDFKSFEVAIAEAVYNDPLLRQQLLTCGECGEACSIEDYHTKIECPHCAAYSWDCACKAVCIGHGDADPVCKRCGDWKPKKGSKKEDARKKIHGLFGQELFGKDYDEILDSKGTEFDMYTKGKQGVFSQLYFGTEHTLVTKLGIDEDTAIQANKNWAKRFPGIKKEQQRIIDAFCSMRQPAGPGTKVVWRDPSDFIESKLGFRRYFSLENAICKALYDLGESPPKPWLEMKVKVTRRDREQQVGGATRSALFGAAFSIQNSNVRAAGNHVIQSTGAQITKALQRKLWDVQPAGVQPFKLMLLNIHDEILSVTAPEIVSEVTRIVNETVESYRSIIPLIGIDWSEQLNTWADK